MAELVKQWNDGSGGIFTVIYDEGTNEIEFSSAPNLGAERQSLIKVHSTDGKDSFGIVVRQAANNTNSKSQIGLMGYGVNGAVGFGHLDGVDLRCIVFLNKEGEPCVVKLIEENG